MVSRLVTRILPSAWQGDGALVQCLRPIAWVYGLLISIRRWAYVKGWRPIYRAPACVLVVGNVLVGGGGKTPTVLSIVDHLRAQGVAVGIVSKGYGRRAQSTIEVSPTASPMEAGDEALLLAQRSGIPVFVGPSRSLSVKALLQAYPLTQVVLCDDGLQDYSLFRDIEICMFHDGGVENGFLLPAGPLREHWPRKPLALAGVSDAHVLQVTSGMANAGQFKVSRSLGEQAKRADGSTVALGDLKAQGPIKAIAGIARPGQFFLMLSQAGLNLAAQEAWPDHADFSGHDAASWSGYTLVCTEKDASKLWAVAPQAWAIGLEQSLEPAFFTALDARIKAAQTGRLSSAHGH